MPRKRPMLTGPNGERRPTSPTAAAVSVLEEITEKYTDAPAPGHNESGADPDPGNHEAPQPPRTRR